MVDTNKAIDFMYQLQRKGTKYSMYGSRIGTDGTADCSGAVYQALRNGGMPSAGYVLSTETLHAWLLKNGFKLVAENRSWSAKRGDITIWGKRGQSAGAGGHVGIWIDGNNWIECTAWRNGVITYNHDQRWAMAGRPYFYTYRYAGSTPTPTPQPTKKNVKVKKTAWAWSKSTGGRRFDASVPGNTFELKEIRPHRQDKSTAEYVIARNGVTLGAVLAQDIEGATEVVQPSKPSIPQINVDGQWGASTTKRLQQVLGTSPADGVISNQWKDNSTKNIYSAQFNKSLVGSNVVKAIQKKLGVRADGLLGYNTIKAMQKHYGTYQDGIVSPVSDMVKAMQRALNQNKF